MFRKIGHIILAALLLSLTSGITVSKHYCGEINPWQEIRSRSKLH